MPRSWSYIGTCCGGGGDGGGVVFDEWLEINVFEVEELVFEVLEDDFEELVFDVFVGMDGGDGGGEVVFDEWLEIKALDDEELFGEVDADIGVAVAPVVLFNVELLERFLFDNNTYAATKSIIITMIIAAIDVVFI